jgi:hypothetical protein
VLRTTLTCILIAALITGAVPAAAAGPAVAEQIAKLKAGRRVTVALKSGETLKGRLGAVAADQFTLEPANPAYGVARMVRFDEARSVKPDGLTMGAKVAIVVAIVFAIGIIGKFTT